MSSHSLQPLIDGVLRGEKRAIARAISAIENESPQADVLLSALYSHTGRAYRIGITGPPGAGKSTLATKLAAHYRAQGLTVGILAVDPTSPFTGGALLGDRIRMQEVALDKEVYIRSMATRGSLGGLSRKAKDAADVLDAAGKDIVMFETVGVGQSELDIAGAADATIVALVPESGDAVQAMKAGLMEIADVFVINKSDRPGAEQAVTALNTILQFRVTHAEEEWIPPVVKTIATENSGMQLLGDTIQQYRDHQVKFGGDIAKRGRQIKERVREIVEGHLHHDFWSKERIAQLEQGLPALVDRKHTPFALAEMLLRGYTHGS